jgi:hypothetical protein
MTYPWASGEVLTAADLNAYAGLVLVKTQTIGTAVASVTVSNAFSSTYDNYRIVIGGGVGSTAITLSLQLGASTTAYYGVVTYATYAATGTPLSAGDNNAAKWTTIGYAASGLLQASFDLINPNLATWTSINAASWAAQTVAGTFNGVHQVSTAYTDFTLGVNTGTLTGGTIRVYGYNNG